MAWSQLVLAGLLEVAWAIGIKYTHGFTRPLPSVLTVVTFAASMWLLASAARSIPIGTAYAVWVGIGATGAAVGGVVLFDEPLSAPRAGFLLLLVIAILGLRFTTPGPT